MTRFSRALTVSALALALAEGVASTADKALLGMTPEGSTAERALESKLDSALDAANLRTSMKRLSARPHAVGSAYGKDNAEFIADQFRSFGYDTKIEEFQVLFPTPKARLLEMTAPTRYLARIAEPPLKEDATSGQVAEQLPVYNAYSIDGDVTGLLVYVNYGVPKDYEVLERNGIDVKGKIVIARYGGSWRGIKPKVAAEHGALGCLIYSDPRDDGYFEGEVYPKGAWRNDMSAQRGSVADMPLYPGDPLTPGVGATKDAKRLDRKDAATLTRIPVMPISYGDALPMLKALGGPMAPAEWRGALPIPYHLGAGPATVHLKLEFDWKLVPAYDVIAKMAGTERPDEWIIRGNHHDGWVNGAEDPLSGLVSLLEEARAVGSLVTDGFRPRRTIVYAAWDGEEPGLLGSTEWVETHAEELQQKAAVYINTDGNGRGFLFVGGSHTLEPFANEVARDVTDPERKISVAERARALRIASGGRDFFGEKSDDVRELRERTDLRISALGSGSDFTPFLQHLGVASLNIGFGGEGQGGSYHSIYDSFDYYTRFIDPTFEYGVTLAKVGGRLMLRLANADVLPLDPSAFADTVVRYVKEVQKLADDMRENTDEENRRLRDKTYESAADPTKPFVAPAPKDPVPFISFAALQNAMSRLQKSTADYKKAAADRLAAGPLPADAQKAQDAVLLGLEHALTRNEGLPGRPWFKHQIYAPGFYTGYGVKTLPGIREALEQRQFDLATSEVEVVAKTIDSFSAQVDRAAALLKVAGDPNARPAK
jgi:N-acetylated-alpha-linked acidic dipeptidase